MSARVNTKGSSTQTETARNRNAELKQILEERRREIMSEVQDKMRDVRAGARVRAGRPRLRGDVGSGHPG